MSVKIKYNLSVSLTFTLLSTASHFGKLDADFLLKFFTIDSFSESFVICLSTLIEFNLTTILSPLFFRDVAKVLRYFILSIFPLSAGIICEDEDLILFPELVISKGLVFINSKNELFVVRSSIKAKLSQVICNTLIKMSLIPTLYAAYVSLSFSS